MNINSGYVFVFACQNVSKLCKCKILSDVSDIRGPHAKAAGDILEFVEMKFYVPIFCLFGECTIPCSYSAVPHSPKSSCSVADLEEYFLQSSYSFFFYHEHVFLPVQYRQSYSHEYKIFPTLQEGVGSTTYLMKGTPLLVLTEPVCMPTTHLKGRYPTHPSSFNHVKRS